MRRLLLEDRDLVSVFADLSHAEMRLNHIKMVTKSLFTRHELPNIKRQHSLDSSEVIDHLQEVDLDISRLNNTQCVERLRQIMTEWVHIRRIFKFLE